MTRWLTLALVLGAALPAQAAAPVYRCGPNYAQTPCPDGERIDADDARTPAQRAEALAIAARERKLGDELERDRLAREAALIPAAAVGFNGRPGPPEAKSILVKAKKKKGKKKYKAAAHAGFVAMAPAKAKGSKN